jgi:RimJ/RimL family protein N-acetyltransferase
VRGSVEDQRRWIEVNKDRETAGRDFYYILERRDGTCCGSVRLYDITEDSFTWGSWILDHNKPQKAALESAVLVYDVGFTRLGCSCAVFEVRASNTHTENFHRRFGAVETHREEQDIFFTYRRSQFETDRDGYLDILKNEVLK